MSQTHTAPPVDRLRSSREILDVLRGRRQRGGSLLVVHAKGSDDPSVRCAVVASRKVGSAVARNRAKRLLREAARRVTWLPGTDLVLVARPACAASSMSRVLAELEQLAAALGVADPDGSPAGDRADGHQAVA